MNGTWTRSIALSVATAAALPSASLASPDLCNAYGNLAGEDLYTAGDTTIAGNADFLFAGISTAKIDFNGDGFMDVAVGAPGDGTNGRDAGAVYVFYGPLEDLGEISVADADVTIYGAGFEDNVGWSLSNAGDTDGDGFEDLLIGADPRTGTAFAAGVAYLVAGRAAGGPASVDLGTGDVSTGYKARFTGLLVGDQFGQTVAGVGDLNGDGFPDVAIGAPRQSSTGFQHGAVYVYYGGAASLSGSLSATAASVTYRGNRSGAAFGWSIAGLGDMDGDTYGDLAIGAPLDGQAELYAGQVFIFTGKAGGEAPGTTRFSNAAEHRLLGRRNHRFGMSIAAAGDLDLDGKTDLWVGAPFEGFDSRGAVYGFLGAQFVGGTVIAEYDSYFKLIGENNVDRAGWSVSAGGDVNGDGLADLAVGGRSADAPNQLYTGAVWVVHGPIGARTSLADAEFKAYGSRAFEYVGESVDLRPGSVNDDGYDDILLGAVQGSVGTRANAGRASVFLGGRDFGLSGSWYADLDGDGWGAGDPVLSCSQPAGPYVARDGDCNDADALTYPSAPEICGGGDRNCDGILSGDNDGDGYQACGPVPDCNDDPNNGGLLQSPGQLELCGDGVDNDCDGQIDEADAANALTYYPDRDGDGYGDLTDPRPGCLPPVFATPIGIATVGGDCDDNDFLVSPAQVEECGDGIDNDCKNGPDDQGAWNAQQFYFDQDGDTFGSNNRLTAVRACVRPSGYVTNRLDCNDGLASIRPGAVEVCNGVDDDCDGANYLGGLVDVDARRHSLFMGEVSGDSFGRGGVMNLGDIDFDGRDELVVGAPDNDLAAVNAGAVYVINGRDDFATLALGDRRSDGRPLYRTRVLGNRVNSQFGSVTAVGDLNGDSVADLVVGAPRARVPDISQGAVYVFYGPLRQGDLLSDDADVVLRGDAAGDLAGSAIAVGDFDGDGFDDLVVGAPDHAEGQTPDGRVYVVYGGAALPSDSRLTDAAGLIYDGAANERIGQALLFADNLNGDAFPDIVMAASVTADGSGGRVRFLFGDDPANGRRTGVTLSDAAITWPTSGRWAASIAAVGDVDGDGSGELLVGASTGAGADLVFLRSLLTGDYIHTDFDRLRLTAPVGDLGGVGSRVAAVGDVNVDGRPDFVVAGPQSGRAGRAGAGVAYLIYGKPELRALAEGAGTAPLSNVESRGRVQGGLTYSFESLGGLEGAVLYGLAGDQLGSSIASGDFDGDGFTDLFLGAPGRNVSPGQQSQGGAYVVLGGGYGMDADTLPSRTLASGTLFIREVYEGSGFNKYVSLFNGNDTQAVELSQFEVHVFSNGAASPSFTIPLVSAQLAPGASFVLANPDASAQKWFTENFGQQAEMKPFGINFNGDDVVALFDTLSASYVDVYGEIGVDGTGEAWEGTNRVWRRTETVVTGNPVWTAVEWTVTSNLFDHTPYWEQFTFRVPGFDTTPFAYLDRDGDGFGNDAPVPLLRCDVHLPTRFTGPTTGVPAHLADATKLTDCNDVVAAINPAATELEGDGTDSDCDGLNDPSRPPVVEVEITPRAPTAQDTLTATITLFDDDTPEADITVVYQWYIGDPLAGGVALAGENGPTLPPGNFGRGDDVYVSVYADDGINQSDPITDSVTVVNTRPSIAQCNIAPQDPSVIDALTVTASSVIDPDSTDVGFTGVRYQWWTFQFGTVNRNRDPRGDEGASPWGATRPSCESSNYPPGDPNAALFNCFRQSELFARCIPFDALGTGDFLDTVKVEIVNAPPAIDAGTCVIQQAAPRTDTNLTVAATATDPDPGDTVTISYTWLEDGNPIPGYQNVNSTTLPSLETAFPSQYQVACTPTDNFGKSGVTVTSPPVQVLNTPPTRPTIDLLPNDPQSNQGLYVDIINASSDLDGHPITYEYRWSLNGVAQANPTIWSTNSTLDVSRTQRGQLWRVEVRAFDGFDYSSPLAVDQDNIENTPPSIVSAAITPDSATLPTTSDNLVILVTGWDDYDGDAPEYIVRWFKQTNGSGPFNLIDPATVPPPTTQLASTNFVRGDRIRAEVTARDPFDVGNTVTTNTVTVKNALPTQPTLALQIVNQRPASAGFNTIQNPPPDTADDIVCSLTGASVDGDGDPVTYDVQWFLQSSPTPSVPDYFVANVGAPGSPFDANWRLPASQTAYGDRWKCRVVPRDPIGSGTFAETVFVEVQDLVAPDAPVLDPVELYRNENSIQLTGTCVPGANDCFQLRLTCSAIGFSNVVVNGTCQSGSFLETVNVPRGANSVTWTCSGVCIDETPLSSPTSGSVTTQVCHPFDGYELPPNAANFGDGANQAIADFPGLPDDGSSFNVTGNIIGADSEDWYRVTATDNVTADLAAGRDGYNFEIGFLAGSDDYDISVWRGANPAATPTPVQCSALGQYDSYSFFNQDRLRRLNGSVVADRPLPADPAACGPNPNVSFNYCTDYSADYYVRVIRTNGTDCQHYQMRFSNGGPLPF